MVALMTIAGLSAVALVVVGGLFAFFPTMADRILPFAAPPDHFAVTDIILGNRGSDNLTVSATITNDASVPLTSVTVYANGNYFLGTCGNRVQPKSSLGCSVNREVACKTQSVGTPRAPLKLKFVAAFADGRTSQSIFDLNPTTLDCAP